MKKKLLTIAAILTATFANASITQIEKTESLKISTNLFQHTVNQDSESSLDPATYYNVIGKVDNHSDLYAVEKDGDYIFTNKKGDVLIVGDVIDLKNNTSISDEAIKFIAKPVLATLTPDDVVTFESTANETSGVLYIFSDPTCHYCIKLHDEIKPLNEKGIEVRIVPFVRSLEHRLSEDKTLKNIEVMGISDPSERLEAYKKLVHEKEVEVNTDALTDEGFEKIKNGYIKGQKLGIKGTPMLMTPSGDSIKGYADANRIAETLFKK